MTQTLLIPEPKSEKREAIFSDCRQYRYNLKIQWDESRHLVQFIGLNPSTADEVKDDNTVRKCKQFARNWGYGGIIMTNLFAFRSTDPCQMKGQEDPVGALNEKYLVRAANEANLIVGAWGNHGTHLKRSESSQAIRLLKPLLKCFRVTKSGQPEHPLYMPYTQELVDFEEALKMLSSHSES